MVLLDAIIAFALTLAALATIASLILEIAFRVLRLKRIAQLRMIEKLIDHAEELRIGNADQAPTGHTERIKRLLANPFAENFFGFLNNTRRYWRVASTFYEDVSLEHTLRRVIDLVGVRDSQAALPTQQIRERLSALALKYDEYCSALAIRFKQNAQRWSIIVGVVLAFGMNVDGFRIFELYMQDPQVREQALRALPRDGGQEEGQEEPGTGQEAGQAAEGAAVPTPSPGAEPTARPDESATTTEQQLAALQQRHDLLRGQIDVISGLDLPIGWTYFPYCHGAVDEQDRRCGHGSRRSNGAWFFQVLITGLLIGLGAPFWYDVARRLAAVRSAFGGKGTAEERHRGDDGTQSAWARQQLIDRIVEDFLTFRRRPEKNAPADEPAGGG